MHALDSVRAFALLLGVVHHAALSFSPTAIAGATVPSVDVSATKFLTLWCFTGHMFRMSLFFLMAGFFARLVIGRKGLRGFWADRLQRILVPLVVGWIVFFPMVSAAWSWGSHQPFYPSPLFSWPLSFSKFPVSYLWFLYYLLLIYALFLGVRALLLPIDRPARLRQIADAVARGLISRQWAAPMVLMLALGAGLFAEDGLRILGGLPTPNDSLIPQLIPLLEYSIAFAVGWMLHRNMDLLGKLREHWRGYLIGAVCGTSVSVLSSLPLVVERWQDAAPLARPLFALSYGFASWCWTFAVTGFALRFLSNPSASRRYVADASYWIYLVHYPIVLVLQDVLGTVRLPWVIKFPAIVGVTVAISLVTYHYLVRFTIIGRVLNGRRFSRAGSPGVNILEMKSPQSPGG